MKRFTKKDRIKIREAGPAGLMSAIALHQAGYPVKDCGTRFKGDFKGWKIGRYPSTT